MADIDLDPVLVDRETYTTAAIAPDTDNTNHEFDGTPFAGIFDGNGHVINNLTIVGNDYLGLFGRIEEVDAEVKNFGMVGVNITVYNYSNFSAVCVDKMKAISVTVMLPVRLPAGMALIISAVCVDLIVATFATAMQSSLLVERRILVFRRSVRTKYRQHQ